MDPHQVVPGDFHPGQVIHNFQMLFRFSFHLLLMTSCDFFSRKVILFPIKIAVKTFVPPQNNGEKFHTTTKSPPPGSQD